jgi:predicted dehydrogenase
MKKEETRRDFIKKMGIGSLAIPYFSANPFQKKTPVYEGKKLGIALVGLGSYATNQILPALENSPYWQLTGIVTGTPSKVPKFRDKYKIKEQNILNYQNYDNLKNCPDIDVVYICLPNSMHPEFTIRAAKAGKHIICEKPMANTVEECEAMLKACEQNKVKLGVGYRCHFEPFNMEAMRFGREKTFGDINFITSNFGFRIGDPTQWRLDDKMAGGGPLMDVGIYSVNAARYIKNMEPVAVSAQFGPVTNPEKFSKVEESVSWHMEFADGTVFTGFTSYNTNVENIQVFGNRGWFEMSPAFSYGPLKGKTSKGPMDMEIVHHQTYQMNAMGPMYLSKDPLPDHISGKEGIKDVKILMAIYESARAGGKKIKLV